ncbi:class I SAM-dependent methyltransferase [Paenibacillus sp. Soil522]|uniref:class I SAM-dependent methyltransferase n=1 Tax=Paenibacillus sp. Soil522 TaxID=1736388 RepID=UPI000700BAC2|nr:class I SAM-dependent methyltransferase [Paenibacillus sp. Soil522]KRE48739.1 hypothetical protein ASG81_05925 [Paenibacillus sp. Soil522]
MTDAVMTAIASVWDNKAKAYAKGTDRLLETTQQKERWNGLLRKLLEGKSELDVLDVGTGPGLLALQLAEQGHRVTGIDLSSEMLRIARSKAEAIGLSCTFIEGDAQLLPFPDGSFDAVVSRNVLSGLSCIACALTEWGRVLRPGGKIVVMDGDWKARNVDPFFRTTSSKMGRCTRSHMPIAWKKKSVGHSINGVLENRLIEMLEHAGFHPITSHQPEQLSSLGTRLNPSHQFQRIWMTAIKG